MATMNISLPDALKEWAESRVAQGRFSTVSDYVRDLIRREQEKAAFIEEAQAAIDEGESSGFVPYSRAEIEKSLGISKGKDAA